MGCGGAGGGGLCGWIQLREGDGIQIGQILISITGLVGSDPAAIPAGFHWCRSEHPHTAGWGISPGKEESNGQPDPNLRWSRIACTASNAGWEAARAHLGAKGYIQGQDGEMPSHRQLLLVEEEPSACGASQKQLVGHWAKSASLQGTLTSSSRALHTFLYYSHPCGQHPSPQALRVPRQSIVYLGEHAEEPTKEGILLPCDGNRGTHGCKMDTVELIATRYGYGHLLGAGLNRDGADSLKGSTHSYWPWGGRG